MLTESRSVGQELQELAKERTIQTDPDETHRRRTIRLVRHDLHSCWGFTLQTYGIRNKRTGEVEVMTYVDYVELRSAAWIAGMRKGDVLLSVNGESVEGLNHSMLVDKIQQSQEVLRLVVLFEDCCRKVELYERFIKLKRILEKKKSDLSELEHQEKMICSGGQLSRVGMSRGSVRSSISSDWDRYSALASPGVLDTVSPNQDIWQNHVHNDDNDTTHLTPPHSPCPDFPEHSHLPGESPSLNEESPSSRLGEKVAPEGQAEQQEDETPDEDDAEGEEGLSLNPHLHDVHESGLATSSDEEDSSEGEAVPPPVCRMRSNSTILNEMRMKLLSDIVCIEANAAASLYEEEEEEECEDEDCEDEDMEKDKDRKTVDSSFEGLSDSEVIVEVEEEEGEEEEKDEEEVEAGRKEEEESEEEKKEEKEEEEEKEELGIGHQLCQSESVNDSDEMTNM